MFYFLHARAITIDAYLYKYMQKVDKCLKQTPGAYLRKSIKY